MYITQVTMNTSEGVKALVLTLRRNGWKIIHNEGGCMILRRNNELKVVTTTF